MHIKSSICATIVLSRLAYNHVIGVVFSKRLSFNHCRHKSTSEKQLDLQTACDDSSAASALVSSTTSDDTFEIEAHVASSNGVPNSNMCDHMESPEPNVPADNETRNGNVHLDVHMQNPLLAASREITFNKWKSVFHNGSKKWMVDLKYIIWLVCILIFTRASIMLHMANNWNLIRIR